MAFENWNTVTSLANGWTGSISYARNGLNRVKLKGVIKTGDKAWGTAIITLPMAYRPSIWTRIDVFSDNGECIDGIAVSAGGVIKIYNPAVNSDSTSNWNFYVEYQVN